jgi:AraC-like DNA-binding protein
MIDLHRVWDHLEFRITILYDGRVGYRAPHIRHATPNYTLWLVRTGEAHLEADDGRRWRIAPHSWCLLPPAFRRYQRFTPGARMLSMHFFAHWPDGRPLYLIRDPIVRPRHRWADLEPVMRMLVPLHDARSLELDGYARLRETSWRFLRIWSAALACEGYEMDPDRQLDQRVEAAIDVLDRLPFRGRLPYDELTERAGASRSQLDRLFRGSIGKTPREYLDERTLRRATALLTATQRSVKEILYELGFKQTSHFNAWFKGHTGQTPGEFRRSYG